MRFGKIDYLNLLPFHVYLKSLPLPAHTKKFIELKKGVPSKLCRDLRAMRVDAAVISSIESRHKKYSTHPLGIVAQKKVKSVLVRKNTTPRLDPASMSSNMLSRILGISGEVIIGDNALRAILSQGEEKFYDLGEIWHKNTNLPFVFGILCSVKNHEIYAKLTEAFLRTKVKIPQYILIKYARSRGIAEKDILEYLQLISYKVGARERRALKIFLRKASKFNYKPN
ncbi:MqnA/MqnD/SBP family protein [Campylobacter sp. JMF_08 NE1]|uniref:MqnA/MqnD/SBP family protein n=1 Tax=Campylobacter sp. JMF_08 NE1 TaxID=2983821 RepID=UPI0022E9DC74|nr:MqnA/MqnD/SBP family protein [Campylobacter sp. JMF_08 NE1]MDA3047820.1 menaquinone via futalosine step 1 [Campylobacter sp. JMF_08 NE1]